jgi:N-carbamoyl-L-amino-acid hydrolase
VELHIEQGPVLEAEGFRLGAVTGVQGISWTRVELTGQSNHAGTTPMNMRRDPAAAMMRIGHKIGEIVAEVGPPQVGTIGSIELHPNLVNVVPARATFTVDVRHTDDVTLADVEQRIRHEIEAIAAEHGLEANCEPMARFEPVSFDERVVTLIERIAQEHSLPVRRLPSGAGHDAQMLARVCPTAMIFTPSHRGISHNPAEHTDDTDLVVGAQTLCEVMLALTEDEWMMDR